MKYVLLLVLVALHLSARAQFDAAFTQPYPARYIMLDTTGEHYLDCDSTTAFKGYDALRSLAKSHDDEKAVLIADKLEFCHKTLLKSYTLKEAKTEADSLTRRAHKLNFPALEAVVWANLGFFYWYAEHYVDCFVAQFRSYDIYVNLSPEEFPDKTFLLSSLGNYYYSFGDYPHAIRYATEAARLPSRQQKLPMLNYDLLGMAWQKSKGYDSARYYFELTWREAKKRNAIGKDPGWTGIALGNEGTCWYLQGEYDKAIPLLKLAIDSTTANKIWDNTCGFLTRLGSIYVRQQKLDSAAALIPDERRTTYEGGDAEDRYFLYRMLSDYYAAAGSPAEALRYRDSSVYWQDSFRRKMDLNLQARAELAYAEAKYGGDKQKLDDDLQMQRMVRNSLLIIIVFGAIITILLVRQRQARVALKEKALFEEKAQAEQQLRAAQEELTRFAQNIHEKNSIIEALEQLKKEQLHSPLPSDSIETLEKLRRSVILTDIGWEDFRQTFEIAYPGFITQLKEYYPGCTAAEYRLMVLDKLLLSNKEMAAMLGVSVETIRSTRSRLKKKIAGAEFSVGGII